MLGLSFKPETDDIRESPALSVVEGLKKAGASVRAFDPAAMPNARAVHPDVHYAKDAYDCAAGRGLPGARHGVERVPRARPAARSPVCSASRTMIDLRNVYDPREMRAAGWTYAGVGRG